MYWNDPPPAAIGKQKLFDADFYIAIFFLIIASKTRDNNLK